MDDNTEHNQSGNPIPIDDDLKDHDQIEIIDHDPNIQAAGLIDADDNIENMHPMNNVSCLLSEYYLPILIIISVHQNILRNQNSIKQSSLLWKSLN